MQSVVPPNIQLVMLKGQWTEESAMKCVNSWLKLTAAGKSTIDLVGAQNDVMAIGARKVLSTLTNLEERDRWMHVPFLGVHGQPKKEQAWVRDGSLAATIVVPPNAGQAISLLATAIRSGKAVPERTFTVPESMPAV